MIKLLSLISANSLVVALLPIKEPDPMIAPPLTVAFVEMWQWSDISQSCSISALEFIMQLFPIDVFALTIALCITTTPLPIDECFDTYAFGEMIVGKINPDLTAKLNNLILRDGYFI